MDKIIIWHRNIIGRRFNTIVINHCDFKKKRVLKNIYRNDI